MKIEFRIIEGEVIAVFTECSEGSGLLMSYMHVGQHGACSSDINTFTIKADENQYKPLLNEIESIYSDEIIEVV